MPEVREICVQKRTKLEYNACSPASTFAISTVDGCWTKPRGDHKQLTVSMKFLSPTGMVIGKSSRRIF